MTGGTKRGRIDRFDPKIKSLDLLGKTVEDANTSVEMKDVLAIFFGTVRGKAPREPQGTGIIVKLINDRQVRGVSPDYSAGAESLILIPTPKRGSVDYIWVPARAVKGIELTD